MTDQPEWYEGDKTAYKHENSLLRAEIDRLRTRISELEDPHYLKGLRAEIGRLRAVLQRIADYDGTHGESVRELARAALAETKAAEVPA